MTTGDVISQRELSFVESRAADAPAVRPGADNLNLEKLECNAITRALELASDNVTQAARLLGITRDALRYRLEKLDLRARGAAGADGE
jgi:DNA-binding NtrC family response regulator